MQVEFWFDPVCPFCWMTSRWLVSVAPERDLDITWRSISLLFKNQMGEDHPFYARASRTRDLLRVVEAVRAAGHGDRIGALYTEFGRHIHMRQNPGFDEAAVLASLGLDAGLASAAQDESWDDAIRSSMDDGLALTGNDVGTPLIAVTGKRGRVGLFGPVITEYPDHDDALDLWDGFVKMVDTNGFFELKRTRTSMPNFPDESVLGPQP